MKQGYGTKTLVADVPVKNQEYQKGERPKLVKQGHKTDLFDMDKVKKEINDPGKDIELKEDTQTVEQIEKEVKETKVDDEVDDKDTEEIVPDEPYSEDKVVERETKSTGKIKTILTTLSYIAMAVCFAKQKLINLFPLLRRKKTARRKSKMFVQRTETRIKWLTLKRKLAKFGKWVKKGMVWTKNKLIFVATFIKKTVLKIVEKVMNSWLIKFLSEWSCCLNALYGAANLGMTIFNLVKFVTYMAASHGAYIAVVLPRVIVNIFCLSPTIALLINFLTNEWHKKDSPVSTKFYNYGYVIGRILYIIITIITSRRRRIRRKIY